MEIHMIDLTDFDPTAAAIKLDTLRRAGSGAGPGAFAVLRVALTGQGSISADDLWRFDTGNREAAMGLLCWALRVGYDAVPVPETLRQAIYAEAHNT
jgi:hypothetical protein